jgi:AcrR family transcriptional regulator
MSGEISRGAATRERLMRAGAELLGEVGIERISTNLVARRAGVTPPVFYRHFADKYALLAALGEALMEAQNDILYAWLEGTPGGWDRLLARHEAFILDSIEATRAVPGAIWIMRALRAVPALTEIRLASHETVTERIVAFLAPDLGGAPPGSLRLTVRLAVEAGYAAIEMALEDPDYTPAEIAATLTRIWLDGLSHGLEPATIPTP